MTNVTLSIDEEDLRQARILALLHLTPFARTFHNRNLAKYDIRLLYRHPQYVDVSLHIFYPH